jgi:hypothetical protein
MSFVQKSFKVSLADQLKTIVGISHQSSFCSATFSDLEVTVRSSKPGKGYIYVDGILKSNDNKALVLLIITIADNGSLAAGEPMIFSTPSSFDKVPTTVQKEFGTTSSTDGLDLTEPADNPNITPCVNVNDINSKFAAFDSESSVKPKVLVGYCINNNKWCINYTQDRDINENSDYILYDKNYDGLLDAVNEAFNLLTADRTTKEKVSVITSGSTGPASKNQNSTVYRTNRMVNSVAINVKSFVILDFENNYIFVDNSQTFKNDAGTEYNINCFIDMERGINNSTICNINLMGEHTYGAFLAQCYFILFKNFNIQIAKGQSRAAGIGIRAQSQANAVRNVELARWSHDLYFDNCSFNGTGEHGIETFNVYNMYATTIKCTDIGGCGILLNCTYNAWINQVIGVRCCASGTYAAARFANDAGPNINIHYVYGEACGNGIFLVSSSNDITIDKINLINTHSTPVYVGGSAGLHLQSGKIITNGRELKFSNFNGTTGTAGASTGNAIFLVNGSSSHFLPQWNDVFENIKIEGYDTGYTERYKMSSNFNVYNNIDTSKCKKVSNGDATGTGTNEDIPFAFCVINGKKGAGYDVTTGNREKSGDYTYALTSDSSSYIITEYSGSEEVVMIPTKYNGKNVSRIGSFAFYGNDKILSVNIGTNIQSLGGLCFGNCLNLKNVTFLNGGSYELGHCCFRGCTKLSTLDLTGVKILRASCFAWCTGLKDVVCPKSVVYFGGNCFYNCNINLTIECDNSGAMTVEPYAFYFIGQNSTINFKGISMPTNLIGVPARGKDDYYYNSQSFLEQNLYKPGVWCDSYYHVAVMPTFK